MLPALTGCASWRTPQLLSQGTVSLWLPSTSTALRQSCWSCWRQPGVCHFLIVYSRSQMSVSLYCIRIQNLPSPRPRAERTYLPASAACLLVLLCPFYRKKSWASIKTPSEPVNPHCCWLPGTTKHHLPEGTWQVFKSGCTKH